MKHNIVVERFGVRLRPVQLEDAPFIVRLRNSPHAMGRVGDSACGTTDQEVWLEHYFDRDGDYYFIVERARTGEPVGTWGVYNIKGKEGEGGRWIILPDCPAAAASVWLGFHVIFDILKLEAVMARIVETNKTVVAFHKRIGDPYIGRFEGEQMIGGVPVAMIHFRATPADWPAISERLSYYAALAEEYL